MRVGFPDFETVTRAHTHAQAIWRTEALSACLPGLLDQAISAHIARPASVRLLGVTVSGLTTIGSASGSVNRVQMSLLQEAADLP